jgi:hypothetical protein
MQVFPHRSLARGETVNILAGLVWFQPHVAEALLKLHCLSPIDGCTYLGVDSGEPTLQVWECCFLIFSATC